MRRADASPTCPLAQPTFSPLAWKLVRCTARDARQLGCTAEERSGAGRLSQAQSRVGVRLAPLPAPALLQLAPGCSPMQIACKDTANYPYVISHSRPPVFTVRRAERISSVRRPKAGTSGGVPAKIGTVGAAEHSQVLKEQADGRKFTSQPWADAHLVRYPPANSPPAAAGCLLPLLLSRLSLKWSVLGQGTTQSNQGSCSFGWYLAASAFFKFQHSTLGPPWTGRSATLALLSSLSFLPPPSLLTSTAMELQGSCRCGAVKFSCLSHTPYPYMRCYCCICRKLAGSGGCGINIMAQHDSLKIQEGEDKLEVYRVMLPGESGGALQARRPLCTFHEDANARAAPGDSGAACSAGQQSAAGCG